MNPKASNQLAIGGWGKWGKRKTDPRWLSAGYYPLGSFTWTEVVSVYDCRDPALSSNAGQSKNGMKQMTRRVPHRRSSRGETTILTVDSRPNDCSCVNFGIRTNSKRLLMLTRPRSTTHSAVRRVTCRLRRARSHFSRPKTTICHRFVYVGTRIPGASDSLRCHSKASPSPPAYQSASEQCVCHGRQQHSHANNKAI